LRGAQIQENRRRGHKEIMTKGLMSAGNEDVRPYGGAFALRQRQATHAGIFLFRVADAAEQLGSTWTLDRNRAVVARACSDIGIYNEMAR
jgi:hypothetical protein